MKKLSVIVAALLAALFIAGCASSAPASSGPSASDLMSSAKNNAPDGTLIGQGSAKEKDKDASEKKAQERALFGLAKGMIYIVGELVDEQVASGRLASSVSDEFRQLVTTILSRTVIRDAVKVDSGFGSGDTAWAVYYLTKADTLKAINVAVNSAKEQVAAGNFNTSNFDAKYAAAIAREWKN